MFDIFSVIRFSPSVAVLLTVALVAFSGCRALSSGETATPSLTPSTPDQYAAFRPVLPDEFIPPFPSLEPPRIEPIPNIVVQPNSDPSSIDQSKIDELNRRITELETQLEEARQTPPAAHLFETPPDKNLSETTELRVMQSLPIINRQGVNVFEDESQNVRIEIADRSLFMPNTWQLTPEGEETLRVIAAEIKAYNNQSVLDIEGHTDSLMGDPNNPMQKHEISSVKTKVVMDFFVNALRWDASQVGTSSFGRIRPIADNGTPEGRARNNRIEIVIRN